MRDKLAIAVLFAVLIVASLARGASSLFDEPD
jgi:hypothetical protein